MRQAGKIIFRRIRGRIVRMRVSAVRHGAGNKIKKEKKFSDYLRQGFSAARKKTTLGMGVLAGGISAGVTARFIDRESDKIDAALERMDQKIYKALKKIKKRKKRG